MEFAARIRGQTLTTLVERAIRDACDQVRIRSDDDNHILNWQSFWDPDEGVRTLKLLACVYYPSTYEEDDLRVFTEAHWEFFYDSQEAKAPRRGYVEILWGKIGEYRRIWREQRDSDFWAAGREMSADLSAAKVRPPTWPRENGTEEVSEPRAKRLSDVLGDDIPF